MSRRKLGSIAVILLLIAGVVYLSLTSGSLEMSLSDIVRTLLGISSDRDHSIVIFEYRLPRIFLAVLVGFGLAIAGAVIQGVTNNGLADPGILGISAGAGAGIVAFIFFFQGSVVTDHWFSIFIRPLFGWIGGITAAAIIFFLSWKKGALDVPRFVLIGIAVSAGFSAITMYFSLKMDPNDYEKATVWLHGSIYNATWEYILSALPWLLLLSPVLLFKHRILDLFHLGDHSVRGLGIVINRERIVLIACSVGLVSACVAIAGNITFIGLIAPHLARQLVGVRYRYLLPTSGLVGVLLVLVSDYIARNVAPTEIPVGIVAAMIGVPYFVYLLLKRKV